MDAKTKRVFEQVKRDINSAIDEIAKQCPEMADHLREYIVFDEEKGTVCYTGDIKWNTSSLPDLPQ